MTASGARSLGVLLVAAALVAACGGDDGDVQSVGPSTSAAAPTSLLDDSTAPVVVGLDALVVAVDGPSAGPAWSIPVSEETPVAADYLNAGGGVLVVGDTSCTGAGTLLFVEEATGEALGQLDGMPDTFAGPATVGSFGGGRFVSAGFDDGGLAFAVAVDLDDGSEVWRLALDDLETADLRADPLVLAWVSEAGSTLLAVDRTAGQERWRADVSGLRVAGVRTADGVVAVSGFAPGGSGGARVVTLDLADGGELVSIPLSPGSDRDSVELLDGGIVAGMDPTREELVAYDARSGDERWRAPGLFLLQPIADESHAIGGGVLAQRAGEDRFVLVDAVAGEVRWEAGPSSSLVGLTDDAIVAAEGTADGGVGTLVAYDAGSGEVRWSVATDGLGVPLDSFGAAFPAGDRLYLLAACPFE